MDSYKQTKKSHQKSGFAEKGQLQCIGVDGKKDKKTLQKETQIIDGEEVEKFVIKPQEHNTYKSLLVNTCATQN